MSEELPRKNGRIHGAIAAIMKEVGGVGKNRQNSQQNYKFRGIADMYLACQPLMAKHGVHLAPHRVVSDTAEVRETAKGGKMLHVRQVIQFRFYHEDGSFVACTTTGEAMDSGDKASNKAMSAAAKYALIQTFAIPEEDPDIDTENASPELAAAPTPPPSAAPRAGAAIATTAAAEIDAIKRMVGLDLGWTAKEATAWVQASFNKAKLAELTPEELGKAKSALADKVKEKQAAEAA